jgi:hypothetical protein
VEALVAEFPGTVRMSVVELGSTAIAGIVRAYDIRLPSIRNEPKDTVDYLTVINAKSEFMARVVAENPGAPPTSPGSISTFPTCFSSWNAVSGFYSGWAHATVTKILVS